MTLPVRKTFHGNINLGKNELSGKQSNIIHSESCNYKTYNCLKQSNVDNSAVPINVIMGRNMGGMKCYKSPKYVKQKVAACVHKQEF